MGLQPDAAHSRARRLLLHDTQTRTPLREIVAYLAIAYSLALTVALALPDANINLLLSVMVPAVTVGILTFTIHRKGQRRSVWHTIGLARAGLKAWPAAIVLPFVLVAGAYGTAVAIGAGDLDVHLKDATPDWAINLLIGLIIGTVIIVGEEIGWRGYLLPRFQQLTSKRRAAVVTGFAHGCFHLPLILLATTYDTGSAKWFAAPMAVARDHRGWRVLRLDLGPRARPSGRSRSRTTSSTPSSTWAPRASWRQRAGTWRTSPARPGSRRWGSASSRRSCCSGGLGCGASRRSNWRPVQQSKPLVAA